MTIAEPVWFRYAEWDYSDPSFPVLIGLRKDTPPEIVRRFKREQGGMGTHEGRGRRVGFRL